MRTVTIVVDNIEVKERDLNFERIDYYSVAMELLYAGDARQRRCINHLMKHFRGVDRDEEIREFIQCEIMLGKLGV